MISVVIPCYNQGRFMQEALDSLYSQTYKDIEIICVDAASIDETRDVLNLNKNAIRIITLKKDGLAEAINAGIEEARGDILTGFAQDDMFEPTFFEKAVKIFENPKIGVVTSDMRFIGDQNWVYKRVHGWNLKTLLQGNHIHGGSLFRKEIVKDGWDLKAEEYADWETWCRACSQGWELGYIPEPMYIYRMHADQFSQVKGLRPDLTKYIRDKYDKLNNGSVQSESGVDETSAGIFKGIIR